MGPAYVPVNRWMDRHVVICTVQFYRARGRNYITDKTHADYMSSRSARTTKPGPTAGSLAFWALLCKVTRSRTSDIYYCIYAQPETCNN